MKNLRNFALAAFALLGFAACQQEEFAPEIKNPTHSVTFVAGAPETKTTVDISDGATAQFAWTAEDEGRIAIYENGEPANTVVCGLDNETGKMSIMAEFGGNPTGNETYVAVVNSSNDGQIMISEAYDEDADILVSKAVSSFDENQSVKLQFKREVAIAKMTLKGLDAGEVVNHITVSSTADIAGSYGVDGWNSTKTSLDIYSAKALDDKETYSIVANEAGEAVVWFTCIPQDAATLTVQVQAADGDTYTKEFSKPITLTRGDVKAFGVALEKDGWFLVKDAGSLAVGDVIVIVAAGSNVALSTTQNDNNRGQQAITKNADNTVTIDDKVQQLTLGAGTSTGTFSLSTGSGYLYAASSSKNYLRTQTTLDANGSWTITIASNNATITAQGTNTNKILKYNSSSKLFSCYSSGQGAVQIYKLSGSSKGGGETGGGETGGGETGPYLIEFKTGSNNNSTIGPQTAVSTVVSSDSEQYITSFTSSCSKAYYATTNGVKLGSSSAAGTLEFTLADKVKSNVVSIKVETAKYGSDTGTITMYNGSTELKSGIAPSEVYTHEFTSPTTVESLKFVTSSKRAYISKITITVGK